MSKRKSSKSSRRAATAAMPPKMAKSHARQGSSAAPESSGMFSAAAIRETVESVVIAFVLAFLFRTFEAEAFVIPTGSMAPTLMGRHKDYQCPICGHWYQISASEEINQETNQPTGLHVEAGTCPMCRYTADLAPGNPQDESYPSYSGDRILVGKFAYQFSKPERWNVAVFKYPGNAVTNYIKRIVGLPGETIIIRGGDIFVADKKHQESGEEIARKPPRKLRAMLQLVYDNQYTPKLAAYGFPARWQGADAPGVAGRFETPEGTDGSVFHTDGANPAETWLRYSHRVPTFLEWQAVGRDGQLPPEMQPEPQLVCDFTAYNTSSQTDRQPPRRDVLNGHWVGDLALECTAEVQSDSGQVMLELIEGGEQFQLRFDVATGQASLSIASMPDWKPTAMTDVHGPGTYDLRFANCDNKLFVWVDDEYIEFDKPTTYPELSNETPTQADFQPASVGSHACTMQVTNLRLWRDVYYIAASSINGRGSLTDYRDGYGSQPPDMHVPHSARRQEVFQMEEDQFFMLGDNSLRSKDGRLWSEPGPNGPKHYVKRDALIGKAILIYWPHSWNRIPGTPIPFPFFPNFEGMGFVR